MVGENRSSLMGKHRRVNFIKTGFSRILALRMSGSFIRDNLLSCQFAYILRKVTERSQNKDSV